LEVVAEANGDGPLDFFSYNFIGSILSILMGYFGYFLKK